MCFKKVDWCEYVHVVAHLLVYMSDFLFSISLLDMFFECQTLSPTVSAITLRLPALSSQIVAEHC